jgi:two-component system phosphate regulon response regulator PhoB
MFAMVGKKRSERPEMTETSKIHTADGLGRVLVVEDEVEIRNLILLHLKRENLTVDQAGTADEARDLMRQNRYALLILDWMLPDESGIDIAREVRRLGSDIAILMVTARAEANDIVSGLEAGADDFLTKPFEPTVLVARVRAALRRNRRPQTSEMENGEKVLHVAELALYPETFKATCSGTPVQLTTSEFKLLQALLETRGRVLTRDSLIAQVQGENISVVGRTVDTHVFALRKKLGPCADIIETVRGVGYRVKTTAEG